MPPEEHQEPRSLFSVPTKAMAVGLVLELIVALVAFERTKDRLECGETTGCGFLEPEIWGLIFFASAAAAVVSVAYLIVQGFRGDL